MARPISKATKNPQPVTKANIGNKRAVQTEEPIGKPLCLSCGTRSETRFYKSRNPRHAYSGKQPYCRECMEKMFTDYLRKYGDAKYAMYYLCRAIDAIFSVNMLTGALTAIQNHKEKGNEGTSLVGLYFKSVNGLGSVQGLGVSFEDSDYFSEERDPYNEVKKSLQVDINEAVRERWGNVPQPDIIFLECEYQDWCNRYEVNTKSMEVIVKQICYAQLRIRRANEKSGAGKADLDALQNLMTSAALKPIQETAAMGADSNTIGTMIKRFEDERPIDKPSKEFEDVDGIKKLIRIFFLGHMCKMLNIDNEFSREYESEMMKYTVDVADDTTYKETGD